LLWLAMNFPAICDAMLDKIGYDAIDDPDTSREPEPFCGECEADIGIFLRDCRTPPSTTLAADDPRGLLADNGENLLVALRRWDRAEYTIQRLGHDGRCRPPPDAPRARLVDQVGGRNFPDVGLPPHSLAQVRVTPHLLARAVRYLQGDRR
jgi:hypothetical protein